METLFEHSAGSVVGTDHRRAGRNNQDAFRVARQGTALAAVVCDGCGSSPDSEVGAKLGARMLAERLVRQAAEDPQEFVERLVDPILDVAQALAQIVTSVGVPSRDLVYDGFLFTFVAMVASAEVAACIAIGDGVAYMNARRLPFATFADNAPAYLGYALLGDVRNRIKKDLTILEVMPTRELTSFLIGTDGMNDLIASEMLTLPGKPERVGSIQRLWEEDRFFRNPDQARRYLSLVNQEASEPNWSEHQIQRTFGRLKDDATFIAGRRPVEKESAVVRQEPSEEIARVHAHAVDVLGSSDKADSWLHLRNLALGGKAPLSLLQTEGGVEAVENVLGRIEHGVFG